MVEWEGLRKSFRSWGGGLEFSICYNITKNTFYWTWSEVPSVIFPMNSFCVFFLPDPLLCNVHPRWLTYMAHWLWFQISIGIYVNDVRSCQTEGPGWQPRSNDARIQIANCFIMHWNCPAHRRDSQIRWQYKNQSMSGKGRVCRFNGRIPRG